MFWFFTAVQAVYFYHKHTKRFLGSAYNKVTKFDDIIPVNDISKAFDLKIREGGVTPDYNYNPTTMQEQGEKPLSKTVRIMHPFLKKSFDAYTGKANLKNKLILYANNNEPSQIFTMFMVSDFSFVLGFKDKCMVFNETQKNFEVGLCKNLENSTFELFLETDIKRKLYREDVYNLKDDAGYETGNEMVPNYYSNGDSTFNNPSPQIVKKLDIEDDNAIIKEKKKIGKAHASSGMVYKNLQKDKNDKLVNNSSSDEGSDTLPTTKQRISSCALDGTCTYEDDDMTDGSVKKIKGLKKRTYI